MTCDNVNGNSNLDCLVNNNNVTHRTEPKTVNKSNGFKPNGKAEAPSAREEELDTRKSLIVLSTIFLTSVVAMFYIYKNFPELDE